MKPPPIRATSIVDSLELILTIDPDNGDIIFNYRKPGEQFHWIAIRRDDAITLALSIIAKCSESNLPHTRDEPPTPH